MRTTKTLINSMMIMVLILCSYTLSLKIQTKNGLKNKDANDNFLTSADYISKCMKGLTEAMPPGFCWKKGGDAGMLPTGCPAGYFRSMALCYELCPDGWSHILGICYKNCESGFTDIGLMCWKHLFDFYFKSSFIPKSLTNFAAEIPCPSGMYKSGALCYRDCANIGMDNCEIGSCIASGASCTEELLKIANGVIEGVDTALFTILTMGASTAPKAAAKATATTAVKAGTKSGLKAGFKSMLNALKGPFKNFTLRKAKEKAKEYFKEQLVGKITEVTVSTVCGTIYNSIAAKEYTPPSDEEIGNKIIESVDLLGIKDIVEGCTDTSDGGANCAKSIVGSLSTFDPSGILSIAAAFIHPSCDVPAVKPPADEIADFDGDTSVQTKVLAEKTERLKYVELETPSRCIWIFDQVGFMGNKLEICASKALTGTLLDNKVASFSVGKYVNGYFYENGNYTGKFVKFTKGTKVDDILKFSFGTLNLKDVVSSVWFGDEDSTAFVAKKEEEATVLAKLLAAKNDRFKDIQAATPPRCIWVYDQIDLQGNKLEVCQSTDLSQSTWNDKIISFSVGAELNGFLYEGANYTGRFVKFTKGTIVDNLGKFYVGYVNLRNIISSIYFGDEDVVSMKIRLVQAITPAKCILVFDQVNFQGNKLEICDSTDLTGTRFNDKVASFSVGSEVNGFLYEGKYYSGNFLKFTKSTANLDLGTFKNVITTIWFGNDDYMTVRKRQLLAYTPDKCILVFDEINYQGNRLQICSTRDLVDTDFNNKIASFSIGKDVDCYFFEDAKFMGTFFKFTPSTMIDNIYNYSQDYMKLKSVSSIWFGGEDIIQVYRYDALKYNYFLTASNDYKYEFITDTNSSNTYFFRVLMFSNRRISCLFKGNDNVGVWSNYLNTQIVINNTWPKRELVRCGQVPPALK
jgi:hypothetical protein